MTKNSYGIEHRRRGDMNEAVDAVPAEQSSALAGSTDDDAVDESARKTRELSTLLSQAWSGRS